MDRDLSNLTPWTDRLALDMALLLEGSGDPLDEVLKRHNLTTIQLQIINKDPIFLRRVESFRDDLVSRGLSFRLKARAQAEDLLETSYLLIHDIDVSPAVKADLIKSTVKWAGYEPKDSPTGGEVGGGVRININLGPQPPQNTTIDVTPGQIGD